MRRLFRLSLLLILAGCIDSEPPQFGVEGRPCAVSADCAPQLQCVAGLCSPTDPCAAGIYTADQLPVRAREGALPPGSLVRQVSGLAAGVSVDEGNLRVVNAGEPRIFEIDFYDERSKPADLGLFVEARMQLAADSNECSGVLYLWPTKIHVIKICFGGGRIGLARPGGGSTGLVAAVPDMTQSHVYRIDFKPLAAEDFDWGPGDAEQRFIIELSIDGELVATGLTVNDLPEPDQPSDRAPLIGFGAEAAGTVMFDYVRWGCDHNGGPCRLDRQDDDADCRTQRVPAGACGGNAVANELCDALDNDCDGNVDENYTANFAGGRPIAFHDFGEDLYKGENCGLRGACAEATVVCSADRLHLTCDVSAVAEEETCDGQDNDCDGMIDEDYGPNSASPARLYIDPVTGARLGLGAACGVGACAQGEVTCENMQAVCSTDVMRENSEICGNAIDDDCDGAVDENFDDDGDGYQNCVRCMATACAGGPHDCHDAPLDGAAINPAATEVCNGLDDDCDGRADEGLDLDGDGILPCDPVPDCRNDPADDADGEPMASEINPNASEVCDSADNDCDGRVDEGYAQLQPDGSLLYTSRTHCGRCGNDCGAASDMYNTLASCVERPGGGFGCAPTCRPGFLDVDGDVAVADQFWNTGEAGPPTGCECRRRVETICDSGSPDRECAEMCNGIDDDCDGLVDEEADMDLPGCWDGEPEQRGVGICGDGARRCIDGRLSQQCFGSTLPEAGQERLCDNRDEDCDGRLDEGDWLSDVSGQVHMGDNCDTGLDGVCAQGQQACVAHEMRCVSRQQAAPEVCNGLDDDCDGVAEEDTDADGDGAPRCRPCANDEVPNDDGFCEFDCNDSPANGREGQAYSPNIDEICDGRDNDCDDRIDDGFVLADDLGRPIGLDGAPALRLNELVYNQLDHCGACGVVCARPNGFTDCETGTCTLVGCRAGFLDEDGNPDNGCEQSDCRADNVGEENMRLIGTGCSKPMYDNASECACSGVYQCRRLGGVPRVDCVVDPNNPDEGGIVSSEECPVAQRANVGAEVCDELDDDCDGLIDEGLGCNP